MPSQRYTRRRGNTLFCKTCNRHKRVAQTQRSTMYRCRFICQQCHCKSLPFSRINDNTLLSLFGFNCWDIVTDNIVTDVDTQYSYFNENNDNIAPCKYYDGTQFIEVLQKDENNFTMMHINVVSIKKNKIKIDQMFSERDVSPDVIALSETRIKTGLGAGDDLTVSDTQIKPGSEVGDKLNIPGYDFIFEPTPFNAGGVALYAKHHLDMKRRNDLKLQVENCEDIWASVTINDSTAVLGVIYWHPR